MKSLYAQYIEEREGFSIVEDEKGFATYIINEDECYIRDIFVRPEFRKENIASKYADQITEIAKKAGCKNLTGTVIPMANGATTSLKVLLGYGFKLLQATQERIIFIKEIK